MIKKHIYIYYIISAIWVLTTPGHSQASNNRTKAVADTARVDTLTDVEQLREVVVTASESKGLTSGSRIDRAAMRHVQPTSFTDLLELLPGNISQDPKMGSANTITLRETGGITATGAASTLSDDYAITSLGTAFVVDGAPINNDANMQGVPLSGDSPSANRTTINRGVDMRALSTDNIESVDILRGIPSAEYGNLTSGVVNIRRSRRSSPFTARFKADQYSKLFAAGKGFNIGLNNTINADIGYLDSRTDPRNSLENFKRVNASVRSSFNRYTASATYNFRLDASFNGTIDNAKADPDLNYNKIDLYKSSAYNYTLNAEGVIMPTNLSWLKNITANFNASYQSDRLTRTRQVAPQRASVAPTNMTEGVHDGQYLLSEYIADYLCEGKPLTLFAKIKGQGNASHHALTHSYKAGAEWSFSKNYGQGQVYDLTKPLSAGWTTRPRRFSDIPSLNTISWFVEDNVSWRLPNNSVIVGQIGLRSMQLTGLDNKYLLNNKPYLDPRFNLKWTQPIGGVKFHIAGGWGLSTRMPTADYLFPQVKYNDITELNYYHAADPLSCSRIVLRTYIEDPTNYNLRPSRARKWEIRAGIERGGWNFSATYFDENLTDGFRYSTEYKPYAFRQYDITAIDASALTSPPDIALLPYTDMRRLDGLSRVTNGSRIHKQGIEFTLTTPRWRPLRTRLIVNGAWFKSLYSNSQYLYTTVNDVVGNVAVSDRYVGVYDTDEGRVNSRFNTNFTFDTQVPRWGLVFTTSVQCMWFVKTRRLTENGTPIKYMSYQDGLLHDYTEADRSDLYLQYLIKTYNAQSFATQTVPPAIYLNLKASKSIGKWLTISAFVNRIVDYLPSYKSNGLTIRRYSDAYFGMEANITI